MKYFKFLLIGSAPYIFDWYRVLGRTIIKKGGFRLCAINNAWRIDPEYLDLWIKSNDYRENGKMPKQKLKVELEERYKMFLTDNAVEDFSPYGYKKKGPGTMLLNALCLLLNGSLKKGRRCIVAVAGNDCIFKEGQDNAFYGKGRPDPVRYGETWLKTELDRIHSFYKMEKCLIYNVGLQEETLLPFEQIEPKELCEM